MKKKYSVKRCEEDNGNDNDIKYLVGMNCDKLNEKIENEHV